MAVDVREGWDACNVSNMEAVPTCEVTETDYEGVHCECWLENEVCCWCGKARHEMQVCE